MCLYDCVIVVCAIWSSDEFISPCWSIPLVFRLLKMCLYDCVIVVCAVWSSDEFVSPCWPILLVFRLLNNYVFE